MADDAMTVLNDKVFHNCVYHIVTCLQGHFGVQKDQAAFTSSNARPVPEHPAGGQLEDDSGGDGRHLQEAAHPQQQGEQLGFQSKQGRRGGFGQGR